jgi:hypothetical protein
MSTLQLPAPIVPALELDLTLNLSHVPNVVVLAKCDVFAKACLAKWSPPVPVDVVVAWAQLLLLHVQNALVKVAHRRVSRTQLMFLAESTLDKQ